MCENSGKEIRLLQQKIFAEREKSKAEKWCETKNSQNNVRPSCICWRTIKSKIMENERIVWPIMAGAFGDVVWPTVASTETQSDCLPLASWLKAPRFT